MFGLSAEAIGGALCKKERNWIKTIFQCLIGRKLIFQLLKNNNRKRHWRIVWLLPLPFPKKKTALSYSITSGVIWVHKAWNKKGFSDMFSSSLSLCLVLVYSNAGWLFHDQETLWVCDSCCMCEAFIPMKEETEKMIH